MYLVQLTRYVWIYISHSTTESKHVATIYLVIYTQLEHTYFKKYEHITFTHHSQITSISYSSNFMSYWHSSKQISLDI